jgi:hypothetical protein
MTWSMLSHTLQLTHWIITTHWNSIRKWEIRWESCGILWDSVFFFNHFLGLDNMYFKFPCRYYSIRGKKKSFLWIEFSKSIYFSYVKRHMTSPDSSHENCMTIDHTKHVTHWSNTTTDILNNYHFLAFYHFKFLPSFNSHCHKYSACSIRSLIAYTVLFKAFKKASIVDSQGGVKQKWCILQE